MFYQGQMMNNQNGCGCNDGCSMSMPTTNQYNQVLQTCNVEEVPHYQGIHTHVINNCIKKHINIPVYSTSSENVVINEFVQGQPIYQQPMMCNQAYSPNQYQANVGTDMPYQGFMPNFMNPYNM